MHPLGENTANTPAFLGKLWKMVNDPNTDHLICWSPSGTSFVIPNQAQFWYELLPLYYKHNNMSSFVRQLNMYGFHKISTVENGTMDSDKDEIQFSHPYFVKDQPELLRNIKRKVCMRREKDRNLTDSQATTSKASNENTNRHDELTKVLSDVKQLRGRQATVDTQLNAMKHENALLWREVAILRQKHIKQQKIVNKLIQFLVTLVQPSRMTVGVKRGYQLMLNESPNKKPKPSNNNNKNVNAEGPTIHELDNELDLAPNLYEDETEAETEVEAEPPPVVDGNQLDMNDTIQSPAASVGSQHAEEQVQNQVQEEEENAWDKPEFINIEAMGSDLTDEDVLINTLEEPINNPVNNGNGTDKVFLNPTTQDTLLSNLIKTSFPVKIEQNTSVPTANNNMAIATRDVAALGDVIKSLPGTSETYSSDLSNHIESTQSELDQFKDILNGYGSLDANALLGEINKIPQFHNIRDLFNGESPDYDLDKNGGDSDPLVSGSALTPYASNFDFTELLDDSIDGDNTAALPTEISSTVNTPQVLREEPTFPAIKHVKK